MRVAPRRYKVLYSVGKGAFGTVYRAQMLGEGDFQRDVAIKLMNPDLEAPDDVATRQRDEARLLGLIRHRAILQVDGLVRLNGTWAVIMEYIDGVNLRQLLKYGAVPPSCSLNIVSEVAGALAVAFEAPGPDGQPLRIIHRDIKPPNIQLTRAGEVKLLDFGVARANFETREAETVGLLLGTLRYMAPERLDGEDSHAGDIYALGIVLVELLTGKPMPKTSSSEKKHAKTIETAIERIETVCGTNHRDLCLLVQDCLAYDPQDRPTAQQFERRAWGLAQDYPLPRLQEWSAANVVQVQEQLRKKSEEDPLAGETLMEQSATMAIPAADEPTALSGRMLRLGLGVSGVFLLLVVLGLIGLGGGAIYMLSQPNGARSVAPPFSPRVDLLDEGSQNYPSRTVDGVADAESEPDVPAPRPAPQPVAPTPVPAPAVEPAPPPEPKTAPEIGARPDIDADKGEVRVNGGTRSKVRLVSREDGKSYPAGKVPAGRYDVFYGDTEAIKNLYVRRSGSVTIRCDDGFGNCQE